MYQEIRDYTGKFKGRLHSMDGSHTTELYDANGKFLGRYDANANVTTDSVGRFIGRGDLLMTQLDMKRN